MISGIQPLRNSNKDKDDPDKVVGDNGPKCSDIKDGKSLFKVLYSFYKKWKWQFSMLLVMISGGVTIIGLVTTFGWEILLLAFPAFQIIFIMLLISFLALGNYYCCKHISMDKDPTIPIEFYFCCCLCMSFYVF